MKEYNINQKLRENNNNNQKFNHINMHQQQPNQINKENNIAQTQLNQSNTQEQNKQQHHRKNKINTLSSNYYYELSNDHDEILETVTDTDDIDDNAILDMGASRNYLKNQ